jgi:hypothetical protein
MQLDGSEQFGLFTSKHICGKGLLVDDIVVRRVVDVKNVARRRLLFHYGLDKVSRRLTGLGEVVVVGETCRFSVVGLAECSWYQ